MFRARKGQLPDTAATTAPDHGAVKLATGGPKAVSETVPNLATSVRRKDRLPLRMNPTPIISPLATTAPRELTRPDAATIRSLPGMSPTGATRRSSMTEPARVPDNDRHPRAAPSRWPELHGAP